MAEKEEVGFKRAMALVRLRREAARPDVVGRLAALVLEVLDCNQVLEEQAASAAKPPATENPTTDKPWAAPEPESTAAKTQLSSLSDLQSISTGLAAAFSLFADRLAVLSAHGRTRALDVDSTT